VRSGRSHAGRCWQGTAGGRAFFLLGPRLNFLRGKPAAWENASFRLRISGRALGTWFSNTIIEQHARGVHGPEQLVSHHLHAATTVAPW
jgi:hypothetical protein